MKVLVIGASGMLAKPVIQQLDKSGFQLRLFSRSVNSSLFDESCEIFQGDVFSRNDLMRALDGCDAVHISLSKLNEAEATSKIMEGALKNQIRLVSYVSGASVSGPNRWFEMIDNKYKAEISIKNGGIPYLIFRPTWFFESLKLMVRNGKAAVLGKQPNPSHWLAGDDFGRMVANAYKNTETYNKTFYVHGPEPFLMKELLSKYCKAKHPDIRKVSSIPLGMIKFISKLTRNKELQEAAAIFSYFESVKEMGDPKEANEMLGKPEVTFDDWIDHTS